MEEENENKFIWQDKYVKLLIAARLELDDEFENPTKRKFKIWENVCKIMKEHMPGLEMLTASYCDVKWRNLLQTYKKVAFKQKTTGVEATWPYFDLLNNALGDRLVIRSTADQCSDTMMKDFNDKSDSDDDPLNIRIIKPEKEESDEEYEIPEKRRKKHLTELQLLRKEICGKRKQDKIILEDKRKRWEERKIIEQERTQAILRLTAAITKYTDKKIELVVSQK